MKILQWSTFAGACILASAAIGYNLQGKNEAQLAALAGAWGLSVVSAYAEYRDLEPDQMLQMIRNARLDLFEQLLDRRCHQVYDAAVDVTKASLPECDEKAIIPIESVLDEKTGICLFGNSGSGKSSVCQYLAGLINPDEFEVIDPHNDDRTWPNGVPVLDDYDRIIARLHELMDELDQRKQLKKSGKTLTNHVIICDEWPSVRLYALDQKDKVVNKFIIRMGSECRKYNMLVIFCSQSGNILAMGLDGMGDFLENYTLIRLNKIARKYAKNLPDQSILKTLKQKAYCCLIGDELSEHPTHGHYSQCRDSQPPKGIKPFTLKNANPPTNQPQANSSPGSLPSPKEWIEHLNKMSKLTQEPPERKAPDGSRTEDTNEPLELSEPLPGESRTESRTEADLSDGRVSGGNFQPEPNELHYYSQILKLHKQGMNKSQTIKEIWGVNRGGGSTYKNASRIFDEAEKHWKQLELW